MLRRTRHRLQIAVLVIVSLLFQQAALAAYLCPMEQMPAETTAMAEHCAEMGMVEQQDNLALCQKHCSPDHTTVVDVPKLLVPPLALPPITLVQANAPPGTHSVSGVDVPIARSDPPPRLRFCSLLI